jgi:membrane protein
MAIVPLAAIIFAVMKGFGMAENLTRELHAALPQFPEFINYIVGFANNALARTRGGLLATLSVMMLFWAVMRVFASIEAAFNNIWEVKRSRGFARQFSDYIAVVVIVPVLWISSSAVIHNLHEWFGINDSTFYHIWTNVVSVVLIWGMFTFVYIVLPNTKVRFTSALTASLVSGTTFLLFQWAYVALQSSMSAYNAIYGSFAALPLFMLWLQNSWSIMLIGCELSFAIQNEKRFDEERTLPALSLDVSRKLMLAIVAVVARSFRNGQGAMSMRSIRKKLNLPTRIASKLISTLVACGLLNEVRCEEEEYEVAYAPARDVTTLRVCDVLEAIDTYADGATEEMCHAIEAQRATESIEGIKREARESEKNNLIIDFIDE